MITSSVTSSQGAIRWHLFIDGASRNNPGPAGAGVYLMKNDHPVIKQGFYLGTKTNNQAEYLALLLGLYYAERHMSAGDFLVISSDSQLLVRQITGEYAVKHPDLKILYQLARARLSTIQFGIRHVFRHDNTIADQLANSGIDKKLPVPHDFIDLIK